MITSYVADNVGKGFFERLKEITKQNILSDCCNGTDNVTIDLPFENHFFYYVHACKMEKFYIINYLEEKGIHVFNNTLHFATESQMLKDMFKAYNIKMESSYMKHFTCTTKQILDYHEDLNITKEDLKLSLMDYDIKSKTYDTSF